MDAKVPSSDFQRHERESELRDQQTEPRKSFIKPMLTRHESLPTVTNGIASGFTP